MTPGRDVVGVHVSIDGSVSTRGEGGISGFIRRAAKLAEGG